MYDITFWKTELNTEVRAMENEIDNLKVHNIYVYNIYIYTYLYTHIYIYRYIFIMIYILTAAAVVQHLITLL